MVDRLEKETIASSLSKKSRKNVCVEIKSKISYIERVEQEMQKKQEKTRNCVVIHVGTNDMVNNSATSVIKDLRKLD